MASHLIRAKRDAASHGVLLAEVSDADSRPLCSALRGLGWVVELVCPTVDADGRAHTPERVIGQLSDGAGPQGPEGQRRPYSY